MTTCLLGMNCSIEPNGADVSKATAARAASAGVLSAAVVVAGRAATRHVTATVTRPRANSASVKRFIRVLPRKGDGSTLGVKTAGRPQCDFNAVHGDGPNSRYHRI